MYELKKVKAIELFSLVDEILQRDGSAWITVTGMSMYPFLREDCDEVELSKASFETLKKGDIVLIKRKSGAFVLHRLLRKDINCFYIIGDAQQWVEGPIKPHQLRAVVTKIKRDKRIIACDNPLLVLAIKLWFLLMPFRYRIINAYAFLSRHIRRSSS